MGHLWRGQLPGQAVRGKSVEGRVLCFLGETCSGLKVDCPRIVFIGQDFGVPPPVYGGVRLPLGFLFRKFQLKRPLDHLPLKPPVLRRLEHGDQPFRISNAPVSALIRTTPFLMNTNHSMKVCIGTRRLNPRGGSFHWKIPYLSWYCHNTKHFPCAV